MIGWPLVFNNGLIVQWQYILNSQPKVLPVALNHVPSVWLTPCHKGGSNGEGYGRQAINVTKSGYSLLGGINEGYPCCVLII